MGATTKQIDTTPGATQQLRDPLVNWLGGNTQTPTQQTANTIKPPKNDWWANQYQKMGIPQSAWNPQTGGPQPNADDAFGRIFAQSPGSIPQTQVAQTPNVDPMDRGGIRDVGFDPSQLERLNLGDIPQVGGGVLDPNNPTNMDPFTRGQVRDVSAGSTMSVDQLGGANSAFFQNMMAQLQPAFTNQRNLTAAGAKEAAGNLTGSGFANTLGSALNRSLGDEQARLADYAVQGMGLEMNRQQGDANRGLQASMSNQGADLGFLNALLGQNNQKLQGLDQTQRGEIANQSAALQAMLANQGMSLAGAQMGQQANLANQGQDTNFMGMDLQRMLANQGQQGQTNQQQAGLDQQRLIQEFMTNAGMNQQNAGNFLQLLLGQSTAGVSPNTIQQSGGIGGLLGPLGQMGGAFLGGPGGAAAFNKIFG